MIIQLFFSKISQWKPTDNVLKLIKDTIKFEPKDAEKSVFNLNSNTEFYNHLDTKYKSPGTNDISSDYNTNDSLKMAIQVIRGHLIEKIKEGKIVPDLP